MTSIDVLFAGVPVADFESALEWYTRLFGRPADVTVTENEVMWHVAGDAWVYVLHDAPRAGHALVTLCVANVDDALEDVGQRGLSSDPVELVGDAGRKATLTDLEGNTINFIEVRGRPS